MKYCLSDIQTKKYLEKAQEVKVKWENRDKIFTFIDDLPDITIILEAPNKEEIDIKELINYNILSKNRFIFCVRICDVELINNLNKNNIKWYYGYAINTFYELQGLKNLNACYVKIAPPLTHMLSDVFKIGIPIRMVPNVAYQAYINHADGVCGAWIRPEDIDAYAQYIEAIEFEDCDQKKEQALYKLYAVDKNWPGKLDTVITNLNYDCDNSMIRSDYITKRIDCGQTCQQNGHCKLCYRLLDIANINKIKTFNEETK